MTSDAVDRASTPQPAPGATSPADPAARWRFNLIDLFAATTLAAVVCALCIASEVELIGAIVGVVAWILGSRGLLRAVAEGRAGRWLDAARYGGYALFVVSFTAPVLSIFGSIIAGWEAAWVIAASLFEAGGGTGATTTGLSAIAYWLWASIGTTLANFLALIWPKPLLNRRWRRFRAVALVNGVVLAVQFQAGESAWFHIGYFMWLAGLVILAADACRVAWWARGNSSDHQGPHSALAASEDST